MRGLLLSALFLQGCFYITEREEAARWDLDGDGVERPRDCDDNDPDVQVHRWYVDEDQDGYGAGELQEGCHPPPNAVDNADDCDDDDPDRHPGAPERCNGIDDDCDGQIDEDLPKTPWYLDADGDGYGDASHAVEACEAPPNHVAKPGDCDDEDEAVHPDAVEICNGIDDDCDDQVDEGVTRPWSVDGDGDGYGDKHGAVVHACSAPMGYGPPTDCDDDDPDVHPGAEELCNGVDDDCNGATDDDATDAEFWFEDCDGDGYGNPLVIVQRCTPDVLPGECPLVGPVSSFGGDCDDDDERVNPAAVEICDNGIDDNCDLSIDEQPCVPEDTGGDTGL